MPEHQASYLSSLALPVPNRLSIELEGARFLFVAERFAPVSHFLRYLLSKCIGEMSSCRVIQAEYYTHL